jgi:hypothetical protein
MLPLSDNHVPMSKHSVSQFDEARFGPNNALDVKSNEEFANRLEQDYQEYTANPQLSWVYSRPPKSGIKTREEFLEAALQLSRDRTTDQIRKKEIKKGSKEHTSMISKEDALAAALASPTLGMPKPKGQAHPASGKCPRPNLAPKEQAREKANRRRRILLFKNFHPSRF